MRMRMIALEYQTIDVFFFCLFCFVFLLQLLLHMSEWCGVVWNFDTLKIFNLSKCNVKLVNVQFPAIEKSNILIFEFSHCIYSYHNRYWLPDWLYIHNSYRVGTWSLWHETNLLARMYVPYNWTEWTQFQDQLLHGNGW